MSSLVTATSCSGVVSLPSEQELFTQVVAMNDSFDRGSGTASVPFQAVCKFMVFVSELSQNEQRLRQQSEAQAEILEVMKHVMADREAVILSQSEEAADTAVRHKRKADEDLESNEKRFRDATDQLAAANNNMRAQVIELQGTNAELIIKNIQLDASNNALQFECCVCTVARPSVLYLPCKHLSVCDECDIQMKAAQMPCPICQSVIKVRHASVRM